MARVNAEIVKVEHGERWENSFLIVTAMNTSRGIREVTFEVPEHLSQSYTIGRVVEVEVKLLKGRRIG